MGTDVLAIAKTGSGKTLAFLIPAIAKATTHRLENKGRDPLVVVMSPTRELAMQIDVEAKKFGRPANVRSACLYGGAPKGPQCRDLRNGVELVVCTPVGSRCIFTPHRVIQ